MTLLTGQRHTLRIQWLVPEEIKACVEPSLTRLQPMIPGWVSLLRVSYAGETDEGATMSITADYTYRWANLYVRPAFVICSEFERWNCVLHEIQHLINRPVEEFKERLLAKLPKGEEKWRRRWTRAMEASTQDATDGLHRYMEACRDAMRAGEEVFHPDPAQQSVHITGDVENPRADSRLT
jgi:hypothetical protein